MLPASQLIAQITAHPNQPSSPTHCRVLLSLQPGELAYVIDLPDPGNTSRDWLQRMVKRWVDIGMRVFGKHFFELLWSNDRVSKELKAYRRWQCTRTPLAS